MAQSTTPDPKKKSSVLKIAVIAIGAILVICVLCIGASFVYSLTPGARATSTIQAIARETDRARPTNTATSTRTAAPTNTPRPTNTSRPTNTPRPTNTERPPTKTPEPISPDSPKGDGFFLVGDDIAVGKWESTGSGSSCYWARRNDRQEINDNHFGLAGGTTTIRPGDYEVEFQGCGIWIYVEGLQREQLPTALDPKPSGYFTVGVEIAPGRWRSESGFSSCYWARLDDKQDIIDNHFGNSGGTVTVRPTDYEIVFLDCGNWTYLGP